MFWKKDKKEKETDVVVLTDDNFEEYVTDSDGAVLVDFWAPWCGPCRMIGPIIEELATEFKGRVIVGKVDVDKNSELSAFFKVKSIPTMAFFKGGRLVEKRSGIIPKPNLVEMMSDLETFEFSGDEEE